MVNMARHITQDTFDDAVLENMELLEMSAEDAVQEAVQQFEAQGVNLNTIVKVYRPQNAEGVVQHDAVVAVNKLKAAVAEEPVNITQIASACNDLSSICDAGLADRCLAAKSGAYDVIMSVLHADNSAEYVPVTLPALLSLVDGQPDILDVRGATRVVNILRDSVTAVDVTVTALNVIHRCCILHEANRQQFVALDIIPVTAGLLTTHCSHRDVIRAACAVFSALTLDDDVRVPFGKSHEHAKAIVIEGSALDTLLQLTSEHIADSEVMVELFELIGRLSVRDEFCQNVLELGGVASILSALQSSISDKGLVRSLLVVVKALAGSDRVKVEVVRAGGVEMVIDAMRRHQRTATVCEAGCAAIAALVLRFPAHCDAVIDASGAEVICTTLELHASSAAVQKSACMAVRNVVARREDLVHAFMSRGVESHLRCAMMQHQSCRDEAHAALRDLGCQVELQELWTGSGTQLQH